MKLIMQKLPAGARDLVRAKFAALPKHNYGVIDLGQVDTDALEVGIPFRVFDAGIDLDSGELRLERSQLKASGVLVREGRNHIAAVYLSTDRAGKSASQVQQTIFGPFAESFAQAIRLAERKVAHGEYEPRLLQVSSINLDLLWLSACDGSADHLVPVAPVPEFMAAKVYTPASLSALVAPHLKELIDGAADGGSHEP